MARRWVTVLLGLVLSVSAPLALVAEPAAAKTKGTRVTLAVSADEVDYGDTVKLSGKLLSGPSGLKGQRLVLKHRVNGTKKWTKVGTATTGRAGTWKKDVEARLRGEYLAVFKGTQAYAPSKSDRRRVDVFAPLSAPEITPGDRDAYQGEEWTWRATTAPELAGSKVELDRGPFRTTTTVAKGTIGADGAIELTHTMTEPGRWEYRLTVATSALMYGATSAPTTVRTRNVTAPTTPEITTSSLPPVEVHVPYEADLVGTGGELTWGVAGGTLPPGLSLDPNGELTGAPSAVGTWTFTVQATNAAGSDTRELSFTSEPGTLEITTYPLDDAAVGSGYPSGSWTSGGFQELRCDPCEWANWSITSGALPPGMELDYDDLVEDWYVFGTPTQAGLFEFTVTALTDGHSGSKEFSIRVLPDPDDLLRIDFHPTFESIPDGTLGEPYSHQMTAGDATGLTWSALSELPPGLTLSEDGMLSGTPTMSGYGWIAFAVTDGTRYDWQALSFTVDEP